MLTPLQRFEAKLDKSGPVHPTLGTPCWSWTGANNGKGYGVFGVDGRQTYIHRWSYEHFRGPIPEGKEIDHLCRNRSCGNPDHLEPKTHLDNMNASPVLAEQKGERHVNSKLSAAEVEAVRAEYAAGGVTQRVLGKKYGVCQPQICLIVNKKNWSEAS